jgi:signal transduction histidine kinase
MIIKIALIISVVLQFAAAIIAISLIRLTKKNIAWWLISMAFLVMAVRRVFELLIFIDPESNQLGGMWNSWLGVLISLLMLFSLVFIRQIFNIQKKYNEFRLKQEAEVLSAVVRTEENERLRFAKELHDGLGPLLSSVKMSVSTIRKKMGEIPDSRIIDNTEKMIDESITALKEISNNISPHMLNNFGLFNALDSFVAKIQSTHAVNILINSNIENKRYGQNIEVVYYRVICELISNSLKHSSAKRINIDLFEANNDLWLEYNDDGTGFNPAKVSQKSSGMGLPNIRSRINSLNGTCVIKSEKGKGMSVSIKVKLI